MKISAQERTNVKNPEEPKKILLNKRKYNRYIINGFAIKDISSTERVIGNVVEVSRGGMKVWKTTLEEITDSKLIIPIINKQIEVDIVWQDKKYIGLKFSDERAAAKLVSQLIRNLSRKIKEPDTRPKRIISDSEISKVTKSDLFSSLIIYMAELENPDVKIAELKMCVEEISNICRETFVNEKKESE